MPTSGEDEIKSVSGHPAKNFFVNMLTRDIDLQDAILDLLDNCVDGAIRTRNREMANKDSLEGYWARVSLSERKFVIEDNCGGIPWSLAKNKAFCMGRPGDTHAKAGTIGVVGIGMKRAIFKMGRECFVHSNHQEDSFLVSITPDWFDDDKKWDFDAEREKPTSKEHGTIIEITQLEESPRLAFSSGSSFLATFPSQVAEAYSYLIEKGFSVKINGVSVKRKAVKLCFEAPDKVNKKGELIRPYVYTAHIGNVDVFIAVGYRSRLRTAEELEKDDAFAAKDAGWTVVCNDRVVLSNDRTVKTGWGFGGIPDFHNQFSCIAGIVEFAGRNMADLPVTTTKRSIDTSSELYTLIRQRMQEGLKHFTRNTNRWKGHEAELKKRFDDLQFLDLHELKAAAEKLPLVSARAEGIQKYYAPDLPEMQRVETDRRISFTRPITAIDRVSTFLFDESRPANEVGEACFERTLKEASQ